MPSYFFHIALDLDSAKPQSRPNAIEEGLTTSPASSIATESSTDEDRLVSASNSSKAALSITASPLLSNDWRYDKVFVQNITMAPATDPEKGSGETTQHMTTGFSPVPSGLATKGRYEAIDTTEEDAGWGVIRLYRDSEETPGLYDEPRTSKHTKNGKLTTKKENEAPFRDEDCTTLCILAVPSYLTPSDFLGFVGEKTRDVVSNFRMIRTERGNRYMVLMKFRNSKKAREWRKEWNGKVFDSMESERCHVVFVKSVEFRTNEVPGHESSFPDMTHDPFTPSVSRSLPPPSTTSTLQANPISSTSRSSKPHAPPTPALIELPTCPVCLERMDESTGLLNILCQHVFHCSCLQKWRGSGCPVCRYTQDDLAIGKRNQGSTNYGEESVLNECSVCHTDSNLWICLICGNVGCGRYDEAHAFAHYTQNSHCFAMDMNTQRIWDYASDGYVHRIVQNKTDGKFVELTPTSAQSPRDDDFDDYVPREKLDNIGLEYTHLLTSQLDSQRMYFEEILERAADKASKASAAADKAAEALTKNTEQLAKLQASHDTFTIETIPGLEKDRDRATRKAEKFEAMARKLEKEWRDEKAMSESLMTRVNHLESQMNQLGCQVDTLKTEKANLEDENRDLGFFISGMEKLKTSGIDEQELQEGTVSLPEAVPESKSKGNRKAGGKGKK